MEQVSLEKVYKELEFLRKVVVEMKEYLEDCFLTAEEEIELEKAREELKAGKTISLEELKAELGNE